MIEIPKAHSKLDLKNDRTKSSQDKFAGVMNINLRVELWDLDNVRKTFDDLNEPTCRVLKNRLITFDNFVWY